MISGDTQNTALDSKEKQCWELSQCEGLPSLLSHSSLMHDTLAGSPVAASTGLESESIRMNSEVLGILKKLTSRQNILCVRSGSQSVTWAIMMQIQKGVLVTERMLSSQMVKGCVCKDKRGTSREERKCARGIERSQNQWECLVQNLCNLYLRLCAHKTVKCFVRKAFHFCFLKSPSRNEFG